MLSRIKKAGVREMITDEELSKGMLTLKVIWLGMLGSLVIYLVLGLVIVTNLKTSIDESIYPLLKPVLYILTVVVLITTRYITKYILSGKGQPKRVARSFDHPALQKYAPAMILAWAMSESIGVFGLILFLLGKNPTDLYLLTLISAAAMLVYRPKKDELISLSQRS